MNNKYLNKIQRFFHFGNRSFKAYKNFIEHAKASGFEFVPLKEMVKEKETNEKLIGLRHDVDSELKHALKIAKIEHDAGIQATYFIRHTAKYFYTDMNSDKFNKTLIEKLLYLQNTLGHEIGLHTDLMPIEMIYKKDPVVYMNDLVDLLKSKGIHIVGIAPHGNLFRHIYRKKHLIEKKPALNNLFTDPYAAIDLSILNIDYEAYSLKHDYYFSDSRFINNKRWDFSYLTDDFYNTNGRIIILTHTIHWAPSKLYYFTINFMRTVRYFFSYIKEYINYRKSR